LLNKLVWLKNGQELDLSNDDIKENFETKADGPKYSLVIKKPQLEDEASYTVKVRDTEVTSMANLSVTGIFLKLFDCLRSVIKNFF